MRLVLISAVEDNRHDPVLVPKTVSNSCAAGCVYTIAPSTFNPTINPKPPTALPLKRATSRPLAHSKRPTWAPSHVTSSHGKTQSPTVSPLFRSMENTPWPIVSKTKLPTKLVMSVPSPSSLPSAAVSKTVTVYPSADGADSDTKAPSTKVVTLTAQPSAHGAYSGTKSPSKPPCKSKSDGTFGTFSADTTTAILIDYNYRLEARPFTTVSFITSQVLPSVEKAIVDQLIATFFASSCGHRSLFVTSRQEVLEASKNDKKNLRWANFIGAEALTIGDSMMARHRSLESIVGITSSPPDLIQESCKPSLNETDTCVLIKGQLTMYESGETTNVTILQLKSSQVICEAMSNGELAKSQSSILKLECMKSEDSSSILNDGGNNRSQGPMSGGVPFYYYVVGAAAFGIVLVALFVYVRRRIMSQKKAKDESQQGGFGTKEVENLDSVHAEGIPLGRSQDDDLESKSMHDAHNLLISEGVRDILNQGVNRDIALDCSSPSSLEDFDSISDVDSISPQAEGYYAYNLAPVLCSISSPRALASFSKSSYFPKDETDAPMEGNKE